MSCIVEELVVGLGVLVDHLVNWEAKPKNLAYTAIVAPKIAAARALIERAKEHDCIPVDDVKQVAAER
ncbi:MAG: hypothetical protein IIB17_05545 [Chloroflexi bacterium]|nr:hypothetical protein [Chloroflexota bacterium]